MMDTTREAVARAIYESYGFAYNGRTINGKGEPYAEWAQACAAADAVAALRPAQGVEGWVMVPRALSDELLRTMAEKLYCSEEEAHETWAEFLYQIVLSSKPTASPPRTPEGK
jgi:hypothetical protein